MQRVSFAGDAIHSYKCNSRSGGTVHVFDLALSGFVPQPRTAPGKACTGFALICPVSSHSAAFFSGQPCFEVISGAEMPFAQVYFKRLEIPGKNGLAAFGDWC